MKPSLPYKIMFVCAGNICRSPLAHAMFDYKVKKKGYSHLFLTESSGTNGFHNGSLPDSRTRKNAEQHGLKVEHISRHFEENFLDEYNLILVMDTYNYHDVIRKAKNPSQVHKVHLFREWDTEGKNEDVPDPYMGGKEGFEKVYQIIEKTTESLIEDLVKKLS